MDDTLEQRSMLNVCQLIMKFSNVLNLLISESQMHSNECGDLSSARVKLINGDW